MNSSEKLIERIFTPARRKIWSDWEGQEEMQGNWKSARKADGVENDMNTSVWKSL